MTEEVIKINNNTVIKVTRHENGKVTSKVHYLNGKKTGHRLHGIRTDLNSSKKCGEMVV